MDVLNITGYQRRTPHVVGECKGFFAKEQLELNFHRTTFAPDHNRGMAEGRWDFTLSSADTMIARTTTDGVDYLLFMQAEEGLSAYLIGQPDVRSIDQVRGKLLAGDPGDSNLDLIRKKILRTHGIDESDYQIEIIGSSPVRLEAFLERRVAAAMLTPPASDKALAAGGVLLANSEAYVPDGRSRAAGHCAAGSRRIVKSSCVLSARGQAPQTGCSALRTAMRPLISSCVKKSSRALPRPTLTIKSCPRRESIRRRSAPSSNCARKWGFTSRPMRHRNDFTTRVTGTRRRDCRTESCSRDQ